MVTLKVVLCVAVVIILLIVFCSFAINKEQESYEDDDNQMGIGGVA